MNEVYLLNLIWAVRLYIGINASERLFMSLVPIYITLTSSSSFPVWMMPLPVQSSVLTVSYGRVLERLLWQSHLILSWSYACCYQPLSLILWCMQFMLHFCNYVFLPSLGKFLHAPDVDQYKDLVISFFPTRGCWNCFMAL